MKRFIDISIALVVRHAQRCGALGLYTGLCHMHGHVVEREVVGVLARRHIA